MAAAVIGDTREYMGAIGRIGRIIADAVRSGCRGAQQERTIAPEFDFRDAQIIRSVGRECIIAANRCAIGWRGQADVCGRVVNGRSGLRYGEALTGNGQRAATGAGRRVGGDRRLSRRYQGPRLGTRPKPYQWILAVDVSRSPGCRR